MKMNTFTKRIDQSVNLSIQNTLMKNSKNIVPVEHAIPVAFTNLTSKEPAVNYGSKLEELKSALVKSLGAEYDWVGTQLVRQAVNEALALASQTYAPILLLPSLAEEKVQSAADWSIRQGSLRCAGHLAFAA
jgi:hypothetical protein